jgi:hypothetical protein
LGQATADDESERELTDNEVLNNATADKLTANDWLNQDAPAVLDSV